MRRSVRDQLPLVPAPHAHEHVRELQAVSSLLDTRREFARWIQGDLLRTGAAANRGRDGMSGEQVLRALVIKQSNGFSYEELAFHLADSAAYRAFCRIGIAARPPSRSTLQRNLKAVRAETLERINRGIVEHGLQTGVEDGRRLRSDSTVIEAAIHAPTDSSLLFDCVRVLTRLLRSAREYVAVVFSDRTRRAKRREIAIQHAKSNEDRVPLYRDLVKVTEKTVNAARISVEEMTAAYPHEAFDTPELDSLRASLVHYIALTDRVLDQTRRRVFGNETVPASQKIVSIFEAHVDVIRKDRRETVYGHKVFLTAGASGLIVDCLVERGSPVDSTQTVPLIKRAVRVLGSSPKQVAFDGGFSTRENLVALKAMGVEDVAFSKAPGLTVAQMVKRSWLYRRLRHFRNGIEGIISFLKRSFGWDRCAWRSFGSFRAYAWGSVIAANLVTLARHALT